MALPLALTMGEPAGIGGEIALKAWMRRGEGVPRSGVVGGDDRPPSAEGPGHERKLPLIAVSQCVGRIGGRPQAVDGGLIREQ